MWVVDASVAVKWFFSDEPEHDKAVAVLNSILENPRIFIVPDLFFIESTAVLLKKSRDPKFTMAATEKLYQLGFYVVPTGSQTLREAVQVASKSDLTIYDSVYLTSAIFMQAKWLTADRKAVKKIGTKRSGLLEDFC